jgi:hypothetical protein
VSFPAAGLTPPALGPWQFSFNGYVFGDACTFDPDTITGLGSLPPVIGSNTQRPRDHGEMLGLNFMAGRDVLFDGQLVANDTGIVATLMAMATATRTSQTETPLWFNLPGYGNLAVMCRVNKRDVPMDLAYSLGSAQASLQLHASDPRIYAAPTSSAIVGLPTPLGGLTFPVTFPVTFGGGGSFGSIAAPNGGNQEMRPTFVITGPCTNPVVQNSTTGWILSFSNPAQTGYTLNPGDTLAVDTDARSVIYTASGSTVGAPRRNWIVPGSSWPDPVQGVDGLTPGANLIEFSSGDSTAVAGTLQLAWASAYLI